jgi:carbonic anhydrase
MPTDKLLFGHRQFKKKFEAEREVFVQLAREGQSPSVLWIGCSDSRVIPSEITGTPPGELFTIRNIANIVPPPCGAPDAVGAVIEFAMLRLGVPHIVVCGHTECGGIKSLREGVDASREPHIAGWLEHARQAQERVEAAGIAASQRYLETIKANILLQLENLRTYRCVQDRLAPGQVALHGWLYDLHTGDLSAYDRSSGKWDTLSAPV